jgi:hypothetical protein
MTDVQKQYREKFVRESRDIGYNAKVKMFPRVGVCKVTYCDRPIFREPGWEDVDGQQREDYERGAMGENSRADSIRRAKKRVFEYAMLNDFEYFITWTLDKEKIDRYDKKEVAEKMRNFLRNMVQRKSLHYIIVPELHKDGAIHAHGFVSGDFDMHDSGKKDRAGRKIYNIKDWKYGFSTAVKIDGDPQKASYYITKYVEKADKMIFGNFYYAGGRGLIRQSETRLFDAVFDEIEAEHYRVKEAGASFKYEDKRVDEDG